eukprot:CAMPEP_0119326942 /NCGR_PEP_ID=MMETSP1333-20130426/69600_1 /TAXON_ID=418940 /ORGANISM="Scyphosphaera apsteinii, Strain RCC1455" /LENGTH=689 /DNA_ID=CAMNT_0007335385 /DNA_START=38 /DNA_END=2107 /DNA_ORIENTATION=+
MTTLRRTLTSLERRPAISCRQASFCRLYCAQSTNVTSEDSSGEPTKPSSAEPTSEEVVGEASRMEFQAETRKLLDIVANSLYTDKEVFLRELISNASDALEKRRHAALTADAEADAGTDMQITITTDNDNGTLSIQDSGIGMSREDLVSNLGTIARSGSRSFLQQVAEEQGTAASSNVIGQFGVGFYSVFMVADHVKVFSRQQGSDVGYCWSSSGDGSFDVAEASNVSPGTKIVVTLKNDEKRFCQRYTVEQNIKKYSNFVGFPIWLNGDKLNTVDAIWTKSKSEVTEEQHKEFFRYVAQEFTDPRFTLHFSADAPVSIRAIFYVPHSHMEKWGMARQDPGVNLYSRKVLIQAKSDKLLPEWMRFLKGVVDSEDIPLNISRESMQDSALMRKLNSVLSKRIVRFLAERAKVDESAYLDFFREFGNFIKEGVCSDFELKQDAAKLLRFGSTAVKEDELISLDDYIGRMTPEQEDTIYYLVAPTRETALASAYMEACTANNIEVLVLTSTIDEFVMTNLSTYSSKKLESAENAKLNLKPTEGAESLSKEAADHLFIWMKEAVPQIKEISLSSRLVDSPAIVVGHESAAMRKMMSMMEAGKSPALPPQKLEVNGSHPIIRNLATVHESQPELAKMVAQQVFSNALISAGLLDDPRTIISNLNSVLSECLKPHVPLPAPVSRCATAEGETTAT